MLFLIPQQYSEVCKQLLEVLKSYKITHPAENLGPDLWLQPICAVPPTVSQFTATENSSRRLKDEHLRNDVKLTIWGYSSIICNLIATNLTAIIVAWWLLLKRWLPKQGISRKSAALFWVSWCFQIRVRFAYRSQGRLCKHSWGKTGPPLSQTPTFLEVLIGEVMHMHLTSGFKKWQPKKANLE